MDYLLCNEPIAPVLSTTQEGSHFTYTLRISWKCGASQYIPMTFVVDSGAAYDFHLTTDATLLLKQYKRIDAQNKVLICPVGEEEPYVAQCYLKSPKIVGVNMIGIRFIREFGFNVQEGDAFLQRPFAFF